VPAGLNAALTKQTIDVTLGDAAQAVNLAMINVENAKRFLDPAQDEDLIALGYTAEDVAAIRSAFADLDQLRRIYEGLEDLTPAKDFRTFSQRLYGTGFVPGR
jgi:hypothetical protein